MKKIYLGQQMSKKLLIIVLLLCPLLVTGQKVEISTTSGNIHSALSGYNLSQITFLKVNGTLDARDFKLIRDSLVNCIELDLSGISSIDEYTGYDGCWKYPGIIDETKTSQDENHTYLLFQLPDQAFSAWRQKRVAKWVVKGSWLVEDFCPMNRLEKVTLPSCIKTIGKDVFRKSKTIHTISIGENNNYFKSIEGVLYTKDGTILQQYPFGRTGDFTLPISVTKLLKNGIIDASFTNLILQTTTPPELDTKFTATTVWVPKGSLTAYQTHKYWSKFNLKEIEDGS